MASEEVSRRTGLLKIAVTAIALEFASVVRGKADAHGRLPRSWAVEAPQKEVEDDGA